MHGPSSTRFHELVNQLPCHSSHIGVVSLFSVSYLKTPRLFPSLHHILSSSLSFTLQLQSFLFYSFLSHLIQSFFSYQIYIKLVLLLKDHIFFNCLRIAAGLYAQYQISFDTLLASWTV